MSEDIPEWKKTRTWKPEEFRKNLDDQYAEILTEKSTYSAPVNELINGISKIPTIKQLLLVFHDLQDKRQIIRFGHLLYISSNVEGIYLELEDALEKYKNPPGEIKNKKDFLEDKLMICAYLIELSHHLNDSLQLFSKQLLSTSNVFITLDKPIKQINDILTRCSTARIDAIIKSIQSYQKKLASQEKSGPIPFLTNLFGGARTSGSIQDGKSNTSVISSQSFTPPLNKKTLGERATSSPLIIFNPDPPEPPTPPASP